VRPIQVLAELTTVPGYFEWIKTGVVRRLFCMREGYLRARLYRTCAHAPYCAHLYVFLDDAVLGILLLITRVRRRPGVTLCLGIGLFR
jgi:hypothetical protein